MKNQNSRIKVNFMFKMSRGFEVIQLFISSPEPKAHKVSLKDRHAPASVVHNFIHLLL